MKKIMVFAIVWIIVCMGGGVAYAECAIVDDGLNITIPCVTYNNQGYEVALEYYVDPSEQGGIYWKLDSVADSTSDGECARVGGDRNLIIPCAEYHDSHYTISLDYSSNPQDPSGLYWQPGTIFPVARSDRTRETSPAVSASDLSELVEGISTFNFAFYQNLREGSDNLFYSPYSISLALAMTYAGALNETARQMADTLRFTLPQDRLHHAFNALDLRLAGRGVSAEGQDGEGFRLNISNSIWGQTGYPFLPEFLNVLVENYGARLGLMDFINAPENSRIVINDWVSDMTEDRIEDLIPPGAITTVTRLVLTNSIYFNAAWSLPFDEGLTQDGVFNVLDGGQVTVPMMSQTEQFRYSQGENYQAVELLYDGEELSMVILLPQSGRFEEFESSMTLSRLNTILNNFETRNVQLKMPKFTYESSSISLTDILARMGMPVAFTQAADFSGIDGTRNLSISDVIHKAFVSVDEAGTEAAAATAVIVGLTAAPLPPIEFTVDRPFIFLIRDIETGAILFMGRILNPAG
ncbi:MAG: serpin family protein [Deltaproteobacteria bacterium]|nr:serpin family protein [Deltaproteobacteria bacterium]